MISARICKLESCCTMALAMLQVIGERTEKNGNVR